MILTANQRIERQIESAFPHPPNTGQKEAIRQLGDFILNKSDRGVFVLKGYAGTGKTILVSAMVKALPETGWNTVLLAPTGRAAKVLGNYSGQKAQTIHRKIFNKSLQGDGSMIFRLAENRHKRSLFIVDEASMIGNSNVDPIFGDLLENLFEYVFSGVDCKLVLVGDTAQLPPVNCEESPALDTEFLRRNFQLDIRLSELQEVWRQASDSQILGGATLIRNAQSALRFAFPRLDYGKDVIRLSGDELEDSLHSSIRTYGEDEVLIITRSNKQADSYNRSVRNRIFGFEEAICTGDRLMVVKNNYFWLDEKDEIGFIANGEEVEIVKLGRREELYGFKFCDCELRFCDYPAHESVKLKLNTSLLYSDKGNIGREEQDRLFHAVLQDLPPQARRHEKLNYIRSNPYFNALQVKFSYAITCHKAQGGQWSAVYLDPGFITPEQKNKSYLRWLYTAFTRAKEKLFLLRLDPDFFD
ncbi:MAG TPA: AAA family ATPase [Bacteroidia bacterium]|nr:AAA family ATPase [Bacteroidia bacterium]